MLTGQRKGRKERRRTRRIRTRRRREPLKGTHSTRTGFANGVRMYRCIIKLTTNDVSPAQPGTTVARSRRWHQEGGFPDPLPDPWKSRRALTTGVQSGQNPTKVRFISLSWDFATKDHRDLGRPSYHRDVDRPLNTTDSVGSWGRPDPAAGPFCSLLASLYKGL